jgi:asparagine synthase (glutamine-hydrolysing)
MCGIVGRLNFNGAPVELSEIERMSDAIVHRGPDDAGAFRDGCVGLGMRRLSIIDLAGGHQPMQNEAGTITLVFNGEIYNYADVRRELESRGHRFRTESDTESILHAYQEYGVDCLHALNGMFAIALWDAPRRRLFLARDRLGIKPLYLHHTADSLRFASEAKALFTDPSVPRSVNLEALSYFLRYGYVAAPATMFSGVTKLAPATYLVAESGSTRVASYWRVQYEESEAPAAVQAEELFEALKAAVRRELVSDVPLGAFLSGGLDSASIVHLMAQVTNGPVRTYSIGFRGPDKYHNELDQARMMAQKEHTEHHEILVEPTVATLIPQLVHQLDEPIADSSFVVTYLVSKLAAESVKVILSGVGGDELFGGYRRYLGARLAPLYDAVPGGLRPALQFAASALPVDRGSRFRNYFRLGRAFLLAQGLEPFERYDSAVRLMSEDALVRISPHLSHGLGQLDANRRDAFDSPTVIDPLTRAMHLDLQTSLPESLLLLTDKMTMATSLEARVPFLDHTVVELAGRIPANLKIKGLRLRYIQKESMRGHLPDEVLTRKKRGFGFPVGAWLRRDLKSLAGDYFSPARLESQGIFSAPAIERMVQDHQEYRQDYSDALLALLTFQLWFEHWGM